jgi:1,4-alpha-glucan branching enzyme
MEGKNSNLEEEPEFSGATNITDLLIKQNINKDYKTEKNEIKVLEKKDSLSTIKEEKKLSLYQVINDDPYLKPFEARIAKRIIAYNNLKDEIQEKEGGLLEFSQSYKKMGLHMTEKGIYYKEYAPGAKSITIVIY